MLINIPRAAIFVAGKGLGQADGFLQCDALFAIGLPCVHADIVDIPRRTIPARAGFRRTGLVNLDGVVGDPQLNGERVHAVQVLGDDIDGIPDGPHGHICSADLFTGEGHRGGCRGRITALGVDGDRRIVTRTAIDHRHISCGICSRVAPVIDIGIGIPIPLILAVHWIIINIIIRVVVVSFRPTTAIRQVPRNDRFRVIRFLLLVRAGDRHGSDIGVLSDIVPGVVCARDGVAVGLANGNSNRAILRDIRVCPLRRQIQAHLREMGGGEGNLVICHRNLGQRYGLAIRDDISTDPVLVGSPLRRDRQGDSSLAAIGRTIHRGGHIIGDELYALAKNGLGILHLGDGQRQILAGLQIHRHTDLQLRIRCRLGFGRFDRVGTGGCRGHFGEEGLVVCLLGQRLDVRFDVGHVHFRTGIVAPDGVHAAIVCLIVAVRHIALAVLARHVALGPLRAIPAGGFVANHIVPLVVRIDNAEVLGRKRFRRSILVGAGIPIANNDIRIKILGRGLILIIEAIVKRHDSKAIALHHSGQAIDKGGVCRVLLRGH